MLYNILKPYMHEMHIANLFHYITFRIIIAILLSFLLSLMISPKLISWFKYLQKLGQPIRDDIPLSHQSKIGTPTMGGLMIIISSIITTLILVDLTNKYIWLILFVFIGLGIVGFIDDYAKVSKNNYKGITGKQKIIMQSIISIISYFWLASISNDDLFNSVSIPFCKNLSINLGFLYIIFMTFVIVGSSNAVNLTDGLDGLAIVPIGIVAFCFVIISYIVGNSIYSNYLQLPFIQGTGEISIFCASIIGSSLGFLWFNSQPAQIFMGDTGSLSLGGTFGLISVITKHEIVLSIVGGLFVIETLSVIIQVYYFKISGGKRIFKMAPIHHHFEKQGLPESKVVIRFWIIAIVFALLGLSSLKLR